MRAAQREFFEALLGNEVGTVQTIEVICLNFLDKSSSSSFVPVSGEIGGEKEKAYLRFRLCLRCQLKQKVCMSLTLGLQE
jgi:hypothetical protein